MKDKKKNDGANHLDWLEGRGCAFRSFASFEIRSAEPEAGEDEGRLVVEGLATPFDTPTVLFEYEGIEYKEQIRAGAFDGADLSDVIFNYNHGGKVVARTRNSTLEVWTDAEGLQMRARLEGTEEGRKLYEEIRGKYIDRMSFAFLVAEGGAEYDTDTHTRTVNKVQKVFDVSAVDIPAYDTTSISARNAFAVVIAEEEKAAAAVALRKDVLLAEIELTKQLYGGKTA